MQKTEDRAAPEAAGQAAGPAQGKPGLVAFTGTGPGDPGLLTLRAADLLGQADLARLIAAAQEGQLVIRLCPGDPLLFGPAAAEADACAKAAVRLEIVPGMSAAT